MPTIPATSPRTQPGPVTYDVVLWSGALCYCLTSKQYVFDLLVRRARISGLIGSNPVWELDPACQAKPMSVRPQTDPKWISVWNPLHSALLARAKAMGCSTPKNMALLVEMVQHADGTISWMGTVKASDGVTIHEDRPADLFATAPSLCDAINAAVAATNAERRVV